MLSPEESMLLQLLQEVVSLSLSLCYFQQGTVCLKATLSPFPHPVLIKRLVGVGNLIPASASSTCCISTDKQHEHTGPELKGLMYWSQDGGVSIPARQVTGPMFCWWITWLRKHKFHIVKHISNLNPRSYFINKPRISFLTKPHKNKKVFLLQFFNLLTCFPIDHLMGINLVQSVV